MARIKNFEAFCTYCNAITKMELVGEAVISAEGKKWAKCKKCKHTMLVEFHVKEKESKISLEGIENGEVVTYSPLKSFSVGEAIYHEKWDDFGKVVSKQTLSDGKHSILVEFQKSGQKQLLEQ